MYVCAGVVNNVVSPNPMQNFLYPAEEGCFARESFPILLPRNSEENYVRLRRSPGWERIKRE